MDTFDNDNEVYHLSAESHIDKEDSLDEQIVSNVEPQLFNQPPVPAIPPKRSFIDRLKRLMIGRSEFAVICFSIFSLWTSMVSKNGSGLSGAALQTRSAAAPYPFFINSSPVVDLYDGNHADLLHWRFQSQIIFVFYYAPWCIECIDLRDQFELVASHFPSHVKFIAINCWTSRGKCRQMYKMFTYPVLQAYISGYQGLYYTGHARSDYMFRFCELLSSPYTVLYSNAQVDGFIAAHDTAVIGYFNFHSGDLSSISPDPFYFDNFYMSALKALEKDGLQSNVRFAVIPYFKVAHLYNFSYSREIHLYQLNRSLPLIYPDKLDYKSKNIIDWVYSNSFSVVHTISTTGSKSDQLSMLLASGPLLLLSSPRLPLTNGNLQNDEFYSLALEYHNCNNDNHDDDDDDDGVVVADRVQRNLKHRRRHRRLVNVELETLRISCADYSHARHSTASLIPDQCGGSSLLSVTVSPTAVNVSCEHRTRDSTPQCGLGSCPTTQMHDVPSKCSRFNLARTSGYGDCFSSDCDNEYRTKNQDPFSQIRGMNCANNGSLTFASIDSLRYAQVLKQLGLGQNESLFQLENYPHILLIDSKNDAIYPLKPTGQRISANQMVDFVVNVQSKKVSRFFRSEIRGDTYRGSNRYAPNCPRKARVTYDDESICISRLTSNTFNRVVFDQSKDVVVLFTTTWCGACKSFAPVYLNVAEYFRQAKGLIFTQIDVSVNQLPWQFTVDRLPTLIFFPARNKADSVMFPRALQLNVRNLVAFLLAYADKSLTIDLGISFCGQKCYRRNMLKIKKRFVNIRNEIRALRTRILMTNFQFDILKDEHTDVNDVEFQRLYVDQLYKAIYKRNLQRNTLIELVGLLDKRIKFDG